LAEQQAGAPYEALRIWHGLLAQSPADAPWRAEVEAAVRMAARDVGADAEAIIASARIAPAERPAGDGLPADLAAMIERLAARLEAGEGDAEGWRLLAQSRLATGEVEKARAAFARAAELAPDDPEILKGWAVTHLGPPVPPSGLPAVDERAEALFAQAQALAPDDPEPAWYLGIRALQEGDVEAARDRWREVLARLGPSHPDYAAVRQQLDAIGG
jgi:cytochrome c-type biogenesis protein CcmH